MSLQWFETQDEPGKRLLWLQSMARACSFIQSSPLRTSQTGDTMTGFFLYLGSYLSVNSVMSEAKKKRPYCCTLCVRLQLKARTLTVCAELSFRAAAGPAPPRGLESSPESAVGLRERNQSANHSVTAQRGPRVGAGVQTYPRPDALWAERAGSLRGPPAGNRDFTAFDVRQNQKEERRKELKTSVRKSEGQRK